MKLAILSDTHGLLRPEVLARLEGVHAILHAGDFHTQGVAEQLQTYAPLYAVRGNNAREWAASIPYSRTVTLGGVTFYLVHNQRAAAERLLDVDVVIYGHTHKYACAGRDGMLWLNPGSCGRRRFGHEITFAMMEIENGSFQVEKVTISPDGPA